MSLSRRAVLGGGLGTGLGLVLGGLTSCDRGGPEQLPQAALDEIPKVPQGRIRLEHLPSAARGRTVGLFTAVPDGHGDGAGLPVCLVLHGASATTADFERFGFGRFLTAAVRAGTSPFVLAGADGGSHYWRADGSDDPQRMLTDEMPSWLSSRGYDASRLAAYGWSMGGYGSLLLAESHPSLLRAVAALSPAVAKDDPLVAGVRALDPQGLGVWCGQQDPLYDSAQAIVAAVPGGPAIAHFASGKHTRIFWNSITPEAFAFVGRRLAAA